MIDVHLHGELGQAFGEKYRFEASRPSEVIRALGSQLDGFNERFRQGNYMVMSGGDYLSLETIELGFGRRKDLHLIPEAAGAGHGAGKVLGGAALIGASFFVPSSAALLATSLFSAGASMALSGITTMATKTPKSSYENKSQDTKTSSLFDGPVNNSGQGLPIPLVYGRIKTGSTVVTAGMSVEQIQND